MSNITFVALPDELICILGQVPYHLQEVVGVPGNRLTKGQTLGAHVEPKEKIMKKIILTD